MKSETFIRDKFAEYYHEHSSDIQLPTSMEKREFGFFLFREQMMLRHKGFRNVDGFRLLVKEIVPSDVFYSSAYYEKPEEKMERKGWLGADLVFDIDADHISTPCAKIHDTWSCIKCGTTGRGASPEKCDVCSGLRFNEKTWPCEVCLNSAKAEAIKLKDFLIEDFGFDLEEIKVSFSGHRGYHLSVERDDILELDTLARKEMVDYITGTGLDPLFQGLDKSVGKRSNITVGPNLNDMGWRGRIARGTYEFLLTTSDEELKKIGLDKKVAGLVFKKKEAILKSWEKRGPWRIIKGVENWRKIVQQGIKKQSVKIDTVVTTDVHRLMRLTNTLHRKTGLKKIGVPTTGIEHFDPLKKAVSFKKGEITVYVSESPQFRLVDEFYGPYKNQEVELPTSAALLLLCKGLARLEEEDTRGV